MIGYFIINKPFGTLSQFTREHQSHQVLSDHFDFPKDVYPVGRLDRDSEGLLLLTNDTKVNAALLHPSNKLEKEYWVQIEGQPSIENLAPLTTGVVISVNKKKHQCLPAQITLMETPPMLWDRNPAVRFRKNIPTSWCRIIITEGKNRQVRKMLATVGYPALRLIRWRIGKLTLEGLASGDVRQLKELVVK